MRVTLADIETLLRHPGRPEEPIRLSRGPDGAVAARSSGTVFPTVHGQPVLIDFDRSVVRRADFTGSGLRPLITRPAHSRLRRFAKSLFPSTRRSASNLGALVTAAKSLAPSPLVVVVGGGTRGEGAEPLYGDDAIRVVAFDVYASHDTAFVADGHAIPLSDASVDAVVVQAALEHVIDPFRIVAEIDRILRPGGYVYAETPFLQHVHEGAYDFWRFTESGHRLLFRRFEAVSRGALGGTGLSAYWAIRALARDLTRSRMLGALLSAPLLPLVLIDRLLPEQRLIDSANGVYFFGRKASAKAIAPKGNLDPAEIYLGSQQPGNRPEAARDKAA